MSRDTLYQTVRGHLAYLKFGAAAEALPAAGERDVLGVDSGDSEDKAFGRASYAPLTSRGLGGLVAAPDGLGSDARV